MSEVTEHTADAPNLPDDPGTDERAWAHFVRLLVTGVLIGIPGVTAVLTGAILAVSDADTSQALVISAWTALWGGVFAGGAAGAMVFTARHH